MYNGGCRAHDSAVVSSVMKLRMRDYFYRPTDYLLALVVIVLILMVLWVVLTALILSQMDVDS